MTNAAASRITDPEGSYIQYAYDTRGNRIRMSKHAPDNTRTYLMDWDYEHPYMPGRLTTWTYPKN